MCVRCFGLTHSSTADQRGLDLLGAGLGVLLLSPILAAIALGIRLTSDGPVLFRQTRIGRDGLAFEMLKFRTMLQGSEHHREDLRDHNEAAQGLFKIAEDPRVTPFGRWL